MRTEEKGATLVEVFGVLAIIAVVVAAAWGVVTSALNRYRLSAALSQLQSLQKGITRMYASAGKYDDLAENAISKLIANNVPPSGMKLVNGVLYHALGGTIEVKNKQYDNTTDYGSASDSFTITFKDIPNKRACAEFASYSWVGNDFANIVSITVKDSKYVWPAYQTTDDKVLPITQADAMTLCDEVPIDITWEFR